MNAIPVLSSVKVAVATRPAFNNTQLTNYSLWVLDNAETLARYWHAQGIALGITSDDDDAFTFWLRVQHDIEVGQKQIRAARLPHGGGEL